MRIIIKQSRKSNQAFTLIEMIGVLAVIAILASMLIPKIFEAINSARVNNAAVGYNTMKTAVMDHYGKYGSITSSNGVAFTAAQLTNYDSLVLLPESLVDKRFTVKIGDGNTTNTVVRVVAMVAANTPDGIAPNYDLDGDGVSDTGGTGNLVETVISGVAIADAIDLNNRLDGAAMGDSNTANPDRSGRVIYAAAVGGLANVHIYIAHR